LGAEVERQPHSAGRNLARSRITRIRCGFAEETALMGVSSSLPLDEQDVLAEMENQLIEVRLPAQDIDSIP
jgi:hypothetical protein